MVRHYQKAYFLLSVADIKQLPPDNGIEIAICGRSNAGKSSVLNRLTNIKGLARVSKTPGRTQLLNFFALDEKRRLVDLPGYGYAKVSVSAKQKWEKLIEAYVKKRASLAGFLLIMDARHPLKETDLQLLSYCDNYDIPVHILLNKIDKLSKSESTKTLLLVKSALTQYHTSVTLQGFSALKGTGVSELHQILDQWFHFK